jgi:hypothetical protein
MREPVSHRYSVPIATFICLQILICVGEGACSVLALRSVVLAEIFRSLYSDRLLLVQQLGCKNAVCAMRKTFLSISDGGPSGSKKCKRSHVYISEEVWRSVCVW